jgi:hypothetical protein
MRGTYKYHFPNFWEGTFYQTGSTVDSEIIGDLTFRRWVRNGMVEPDPVQPQTIGKKQQQEPKKPKSLKAMTLAELELLAAERQIDLGEAQTKGEKLEAIEAFIAAKEADEAAKAAAAAESGGADGAAAGAADGAAAGAEGGSEN